MGRRWVNLLKSSRMDPPGKDRIFWSPGLILGKDRLMFYHIRQLAHPLTSLGKTWKLPTASELLEPVQPNTMTRARWTNDTEQRVRSLREVIETDVFQRSTTPLTVPLGLDVDGAPAVTDLSTMPHLLITGITGSGKSIFLEGMILALIFKNTPDDLRFVMLGAKPEFVYFRNLPHLLGPVYYFDDYGSEVMKVLQWLEAERDKRLALIQSSGWADLQQYNLWLLLKKEPSLPRIVVLLEHYFEFSYNPWQATMPTLQEVDPIFVRLVQTAHPAGIHIVITDQTPFPRDMSNMLKESFEARVGFWQSEAQYSVRALGKKGAEYLSSPGGLLFRRNRDAPLERYQACNVNREEALRVVESWREQI